jgi:hypothetical protein
MMYSFILTDIDSPGGWLGKERSQSFARFSTLQINLIVPQSGIKSYVVSLLIPDSPWHRQPKV